MLDIITKKVGRIKDNVRKGVVPKKMKIVIVLDTDKQFIVQTKYFDQHSIKRPGRRIVVETESVAATRLIALASGVVPEVADVVIVDSKGSGTNIVSYVFWFAPPDFDITARTELHGFVLSLKEQLSLEREFILRAEARITADLLVKAVDQRSGLRSTAA